MTRTLEFRGINLDWLSQWILKTLRYSPQYHSVQSLCREYNEFEAVTESKVRRRLRKLEDIELVDVDTHRVAPNVNPKKLYQLSDDGRCYVERMEKKLAYPPHHEESEMLQYLKQETDVLEYYIRQLIQNAEENGDTIEAW
ncbi:MAG: DNA-binding PadR family transcriptional regulator [Salinirussus sp.]|jgi:DNA-binding PadR family transcriptional regulator